MQFLNQDKRKLHEYKLLLNYGPGRGTLIHSVWSCFRFCQGFHSLYPAEYLLAVPQRRDCTVIWGERRQQCQRTSDVLQQSLTVLWEEIFLLFLVKILLITHHIYLHATY